ncbi:restriction endonuclease subunit S [Nitrosomonas eutropha]|uniref:Type I restriction enzyme S subunit n=2 Tax=Nitrosomonas eutropha TaxID=916 RepID=A0ABX5M701_9PROT|nr:restriction endonuclease subunit S [Nitrosomonas eutropha]ABI58815.1 restriction modification system DNA specificity domain [Nitrosomonas eutropha C91]PXV81138.1 type I restriction enzyme S subunit [Nitrosomonas eutropha]
MGGEFHPLTLGAVCSKIGSGATPRGGKEAYRGGATSLIRSQNIYNDRFVHEGLAFIDDDQADELRNVVVEADDVLLNITGDSVARCCQVDPAVLPARVNQHVAIVRPRPETLDARFLRYSLVSPSMQAHLLALASAGATRNALTKGMLEKLVIAAPSVPEQRAIAHILGTLDDKIELNRRRNQTLEAMARALFKDWFIDFGPVRAKLEGRWQRNQSLPGLPAHLYDLFPDRLVESELGEIPEGWEIRRVSDFLSLAYGKSLPAKARSPGNVPVYGSGGITGVHNIALIDSEAVIVGRKGTVGSLYWEQSPSYPIDTVFYVQPLVSLPFCYHLLESLPLRDMNTDAAVPGLNRKNVYRLEVVSPPEVLLEKFSVLARKLREKIFTAQNELHLLTQLHDTLLPKLIAGELRIVDAEKFMERTGI